jgi:hypothetical protein
VDLLDRTPLIESLVAMFSSRRQKTPFTMAILGDWGAGKTNVMELVEQRLRDLDTRRFDRRFNFAWFSAWEYEHTDNMAAALAQEVVTGLVGSIPWWDKPVAMVATRVRFAAKEYGMSFLQAGLFVVLALAIFAVTGQYMDPTAIESLAGTVWFKAGAGVASVGFLIYMWPTIKRILDHPLSTNLKTYLKLPTYGQHLGLIPVLKRHVRSLCEIRLGKRDVGKRRLIVWIDDLDRCGPKAIAETLDAIRLVMDVPNVIVCLAIDHRIAFRAVEEQYHELADEVRSKQEIARDYLGKIIQLPIHLDRPGESAVAKFVDSALFANAKEGGVDPDFREVADSADEGEKGIGARSSSAPATSGGQTESSQSLPAQRSPGETSSPDSASAAGSSDAPAEEEAATSRASRRRQRAARKREQMRVERLGEEMMETRGERDYFKKMAVTFETTNPRRLSRLRNTYRLLKLLDAHGEHPREYRNRELMGMIFWQEYLHQWPAETREVLTEALQDGVTVFPSEQNWLRERTEWGKGLWTHVEELARTNGQEPRARFNALQTFVLRVVLPFGEAASEAKGPKNGAASSEASPPAATR